MPRIARWMLEGIPFHVTHRGNLKQPVFRDDHDRRLYLSLLAKYASRFGMSIWAYCLMTNHIHAVVVGKERRSIGKALGNTTRAYSRIKNKTQDVTGHLWANRYFSTALDELHLWAAVRYVELNPVRAGMVAQATDHRWSSARAHAWSRVDPILDPERPFPGPIGDWAAWLGMGLESETQDRLRRNTSKGTPTGSARFLARIATRLGRPIKN